MLLLLSCLMNTVSRENRPRESTMGVIKVLRDVCLALLTLTVAYGTVSYDSRFLVLLLPPLTMMYSFNWLNAVPGVKTVSKGVETFQGRYGASLTNGVLVVFGIAFGLSFGGGWKVLEQYGLA